MDDGVLRDPKFVPVSGGEKRAERKDGGGIQYVIFGLLLGLGGPGGVIGFL